MNARTIAVTLLLLASPATWLQAQTVTAPTPIHFQFPGDLYEHPKYQTEWWYFTGNLQAKHANTDDHDRHDGWGHRDAKQYGFELTFFRTYAPTGAPVGQPQLAPVIFADLAVSDLDDCHFYFHKLLAPQVPPFSSITENPWTIQLGSWTLTEPNSASGPFQLNAIQDNFGVNLTLLPEQPPVLNGPKGLFTLDSPLYGPEFFEYYSIPRLRATGSIEVNGESIPIEGLAWNDHEFFTLGPTQQLPAWDWFSVQLEDGSSLMLYGLRLPNGDFDPASPGTYVSEDGRVTHLKPGDFTLTRGTATFQSTTTGAIYPIEWTINIPRLSIELDMTTPLADQEMAAVPGGGSPTYWEGASRFHGTKEGHAIQGKGYLEMTGYVPQ